MEQVGPNLAGQASLARTHDLLRGAQRQAHATVLQFYEQVGAGERQAKKAARIDRQMAIPQGSVTLARWDLKSCCGGQGPSAHIRFGARDLLAYVRNGRFYE
jgi:hypothetical protein